MEKIIKRYIVQPKLRNNVRLDVEDWCKKTFGRKFRGRGDKQYRVWGITSNYNRGMSADFDFVTFNKKYATWFALKFEADILEEELIV